MATTVQNLVDFAETFISYTPLTAGTSSNPALTLANETQNLILNTPPIVWPFNRGINTSLTLTPGTQNYTVAITDFGFLEKVTLTDPTTNTPHEIIDIYNNLPRGLGDLTNTQKFQRPNSVSVLQVTYGTNLVLRFLGVPDKAYTVEIIYQKYVTPLTALTGGSGTLTVPDTYLEIFQNLFLGESLAFADDARSTQYRQRGVAALLSKQSGLTQMQVNEFLAQYWSRDSQQQAAVLRTQQGVQAKAV